VCWIWVLACRCLIFRNVFRPEAVQVANPDATQFPGSSECVDVLARASPQFGELAGGQAHNNFHGIFSLFCLIERCAACCPSGHQALRHDIHEADFHAVECAAPDHVADDEVQYGVVVRETHRMQQLIGQAGAEETVPLVVTGPHHVPVRAAGPE
jgi:hypothetical protein